MINTILFILHCLRLYLVLFFIKFFIFLVLDHYTLSGFIESKNVNFSLSKLFFVSKITILFFSILTVLILYKIFILLTFNQFNSFLLSFLFMCSTGFLSSSNRLESGLISLFLIICSLYFFIKFINSKNKLNLFFFILGFIFLFSAMMQKNNLF